MQSISSLVEEKCTDKSKIPSHIKEYLRNLDTSLDKFEDAYKHVRERRVELEKLGVDFSVISKEIEKIIKRTSSGL